MPSKWSPCFCLPFLPVPPPQLFSAHQTEGFFKNGKLITHSFFVNTPISLHVKSKIGFLQCSSEGSTTLSFHLSLLPHATQDMLARYGACSHFSALLTDGCLAHFLISFGFLLKYSICSKIFPNPQVNFKLPISHR